MVDAIVSFESKCPDEAETSQAAPAVQKASVSGPEGLAAYIDFCRQALAAPAQSGEWARQWAAAMRPDIVVAELRAGGRPVFSLALEITPSGPFRIARFLSGRHANGNFPAMDRNWAATAREQDFQTLFEAVRKARPDIDLVALERLSPDLDGVPNPMALLAHFPSPDPALAVDLDGGFDNLLDRSSGKRKRKKHRSQIRKFEIVGPYRRIEAKTPGETRTLLDAFFAMKARRFSQMGIVNVFGDPEIRQFFHALFAESLAQQPQHFVLHGLEVAGKLLAVTGSSICGKRLICEFGAIEEDDLASASPGDFLFYENIQDACRQGFEVYDFSVGDEPYKRLWCDIEVRQFDVLLPLTLKGHLLAQALRQKSRLKASIKGNPTLWRLGKLLRRKTVGKASAENED
jgi:CelD/BcsL family acetyltransferase involved in cellulose biosynthesis